MNELIDAAAVNGLRRRLEQAGAAAAAGAAGADAAAGAAAAAAAGTGEASGSPVWTALAASVDQLDDLSLRARSDLVSAALITDLATAGLARAVAWAGIVRSLLPDETFRGWTIWPVSETVTTLALADGSPEAFDDGLRLLAELTPRLTCEFAIRRFLEADLERSLGIVQGWTLSPDEHVRRLASEGTRAFLPWAIRVRSLLGHPGTTIPVLDALVHDESEYVRRSVANHLNDLSRENAELVVDTASRWLADPDANTRSVVRHGLRTLIKRADPAALALLGFAPVIVEVSDLRLTDPTVTLPGDLEFAFTVTNTGTTTARLAVDFVVSYVKSNGSLAQKVFKLTTVEVAPGESTTIRKRHGFRQMTTRVHYAGTHAVEVQVNGARYARTEFEVLLEPETEDEGGRTWEHPPSSESPDADGIRAVAGT